MRIIKALLLGASAVFLFIACTGEVIPPEDGPPVIAAGSKGAIVGYHQSWRGAPKNEQLDMITHLIVFQVLPLDDGSLDRSALNRWVTESWVADANKKGVKVSVCIGGWQDGISGNKGSPNWVSATSDENRETFVDNIVALVNEIGFDGLDIDWEYPQNAGEWSQYMNLCNELRERLPGKRLSTALPGTTPTDKYYTSVVREQIWTALDAINLMSYDMGSWPTHSDAGKSIELIDDWAEWGKDSDGFNKEKLILGCAFYANKTPGDTPESLKEKVDHCYDNEYGGVMIWEIGHNKPDLLEAIYDATEAKGGYKKSRAK